jgi:hypothetical protein
VSGASGISSAFVRNIQPFASHVKSESEVRVGIDVAIPHQLVVSIRGLLKGDDQGLCF